MHVLYEARLCVIHVSLLLFGVIEPGASGRWSVVDRRAVLLVELRVVAVD